jgi:hypothetical protein
MHKFSAFNIKSISRLNNSEANLLANVASKLFPAEGLFSEHIFDRVVVHTISPRQHN